MFQLRDNCDVGSKVKLPSKADTILFSSKLRSKVSSPIYLVLHCLYKFFYESISNNIQLA